MAGTTIYHCATADDWAAAQEAGDYRISTRGRTLADEGFLHASYAEQVQGVLDRFYADAEGPLLLLVIDPDRLGVPVVAESPGPGVAELFPHIYGPLPVAAVVDVEPLERTATGWRRPDR
jgi:uncharacterized protein (DUF952 family)